MGGSPPSAPVTVMPSPTAPTLYQSVIPLENFQQAGDFYKRIQKETEKVRQDLFAQSGTPAQTAAQTAATEEQAAATYLSSIPVADRYMKTAAGTAMDKDPYEEMRKAAGQRLSSAQVAYANALKNINAKPSPIDTETTPSWATSTIPEGMPGYKPPAVEEKKTV